MMVWHASLTGTLSVPLFPCSPVSQEEPEKDPKEGIFVQKSHLTCQGGCGWEGNQQRDICSE